MYFSKTPRLLQSFFRKILWKMPGREPKIYLTFDDGPTPKITEWVLEQLEEYDAKATFFCIGKNASDHPELIQKIKSDGHSIGNHSHNHLSGWKTTNKTYVEDVAQANAILNTSLFRPPYGRLRIGQYKALSKLYKIVLWDVMPGDFDPRISKEQCYKNLKENAVPGSIIVLHDSDKAFTRLEYCLPKILRYFKEKGYQMDCL